MSTAERERPFPMAFTRLEFIRGALWAWLVFLVLLVASMTVAAIVAGSGADAGLGLAGLYYGVIGLGYTILIGGSVSFAATIVVAPAAWLIARALRGTTSITAHLACFAALGAAIGCAAVAIAGGWPLLSSPLLPLACALTTTAVVLGWLRASREARRDLRNADPRSPTGMDAAFAPDAPLA